MKQLITLCAAVTLILSSLFYPQPAEAVPAFARQTGMSCASCHFQHFPALNQFGRVFKSTGYTMGGGVSMVESDMLSIPVSLNASVVTKIRYQKTNGDDDSQGTNKGELQFPDEGALIIGGRAGEHVGFLLEAQFVNPDDSAWASFKMPFVYTIQSTSFSGTTLALTPFTTDSGGASYGLELLNTGALRIQRVTEHRKEISAQQYINTARAATGLTVSATNPLYFINYTIWSPEHGTTDASPMLHYVRAAVTPTVSGWDLAAGFQVWAGETTYNGSTKAEAKAWSLDAQAQGALFARPLGLYVSYANADKSSSTLTNLFNSQINGERTAFAILGEYGVIPNRLALSMAYRDGDTGASSNSSDNAFTLGVIYLVTQNIQLQLSQSFYSGDYYDLRANNEDADGDSLTTLMLFAGF